MRAISAVAELLINFSVNISGFLVYSVLLSSFGAAVFDSIDYDRHLIWDNLIWVTWLYSKLVLRVLIISLTVSLFCFITDETF